jgi:myo-inositol 2-dehydrogenase / D-chiro-inositol 1-dehydrogenase
MRIGIIGTGWGLMHVGGFRGAGAEVIGLCGIDRQKTRAIADREGIALATTEPAELVAAAEAIVVASPDRFHHAHAALAIDAGRHVLVEKPMVRSVKEADDLLARAAVAPRGRVHAVNFPYRMLPPMLGLKNWLRHQPPVEELHISVRNGFLAREDVGASGDLGGASHLIDAALWLLGGDPRSIQASLAGWSLELQIGLTSSARITISHRPAPEAGIEGRWSVRGPGWEASLAGGYVEALGGWRLGPARGFAGAGWFDIAPGVEPAPGHREPWAQAHVEGARAFLVAAGEGDRGTLAALADGARVQRILDAVLRSDREGRRVEA